MLDSFVVALTERPRPTALRNIERSCGVQFLNLKSQLLGFHVTGWNLYPGRTGGVIRRQLGGLHTTRSNIKEVHISKKLVYKTFLMLWLDCFFSHFTSIAVRSKAEGWNRRQSCSCPQEIWRSWLRPWAVRWHCSFKNKCSDRAAGGSLKRSLGMACWRSDSVTRSVRAVRICSLSL